MWPFPPPPIPFEQAVYGSFPFWHRGYDLLGRSEGCRPAWVAALKETCQRLGERLRGAAPPGGLVARWLDDGTWMILFPFSPGSDDVGRPDAAAFHGIFLGPEAAHRARLDPFRLAPASRRDWGPGDEGAMAAGSLALGRPRATEGPDDPRVAPIVEAIGRGRRALVESGGPIDEFAARVWAGLPRRLRLRKSLATWAYADAGAFDLVGLPRLTGIDPSDRDLLVIPAASDGRGAPG